MQVKTKLISSYAIILLLILLLTGLGLNALFKINENVQVISDKNIPQQTVISQAVLTMEKTISDLKTYVMSYDNSEIVVNEINRNLNVLGSFLRILEEGGESVQGEVPRVTEENIAKILQLKQRIGVLRAIINECVGVHALKVDLHFELYSKIYDIEKYFYRLSNETLKIDFEAWYRSNRIKNKKIQNYIDKYAQANEAMDEQLKKRYSEKIIKTSARTLDMITESERINFDNLMKEANVISAVLDEIESSITEDYAASKQRIAKTFSDTIKISIAVVLLIILVSVIIATMVGRSINTSLNDFKTGLISFFRFINNETAHVEPIAIKSDDEFGNMAAILNENIRHSSKLHTELLALKNELARKVEERTKELKASNLQLLELNSNLEEQVEEGIARNIKAELQLFEQSKMASMGNMIGNIAHQWKQPLSVIEMTANNIILDLELDSLDEETLLENSKKTVEMVHYLTDTINTFRNFVKEKKERKVVILQDRLDMALAISNTVLKDNHIELINRIDYDTPIKISLVVGELIEVIINILNNAKDALVENKVSDPWVQLDLSADPTHVTIHIEDNAGGIPDEILDFVFDEYFTTKEKIQGTGLGLYMSKQIIETSLNGKLVVENTQNGAKFSITLPLRPKWKS